MIKKCSLIFDIGKTNQKFFLFDEKYNLLKNGKTSIPKVKDEDGFQAENIDKIIEWIKNYLNSLIHLEKYSINTVNFSAFGATIVNLDKNGKITTPVYDYNKPIEKDLINDFYKKYGSKKKFSGDTGSINLNMLNSGKQLYWLKYTKPEVYNKIKHSLHLPQYLSYVFTNKMFTDYTSIGCHTDLWNFKTKQYHKWVRNEKINSLFPPIVKTNKTLNINYKGKKISFGIGIHDSSSALLKYLIKDKNKFILLSTGTWCINFNPFSNDQLFNKKDIQSGVTLYMKIDGGFVKTSRLYLGKEHEEKVKKLEDYYKSPKSLYKNLVFNKIIYKKVNKSNTHFNWVHLDKSNSPNQDILNFSSFEIAYYQLVFELICLLMEKIKIISIPIPKKIYLDGGFSDNDVFINILKKQFPKHQVISKPNSYASALGAAMVCSINNN